MKKHCCWKPSGNKPLSPNSIYNSKATTTNPEWSGFAGGTMDLIMASVGRCPMSVYCRECCNQQDNEAYGRFILVLCVVSICCCKHWQCDKTCGGGKDEAMDSAEYRAQINTQKESETQQGICRRKIDLYHYCHYCYHRCYPAMAVVL